MRFDNRGTMKNFDRHYSHLKNTDNVKQDLQPIIHYTTPELRYPTLDESRQLQVNTEIWKVGDRLFKYADKHYGAPKKWWVIAWYNGVPSEADFQIGQTVYIPTPLSEILDYFGY